MQDNANITYVYAPQEYMDNDDGQAESPFQSSVSPSLSSSDSGVSLVEGLHQRIDNTERQTRDLSNMAQSQFRLLQQMMNTQTQLDRNASRQRAAMGGLLSVIEQNKMSIEQIQQSTRILFQNQQEAQRDVGLFKEQLFTLAQSVETLQQQQIRGTVLREPVRGTPQQQPSHVGELSAEEMAIPRGITFTDDRGRSEFSNFVIILRIIFGLNLMYALSWVL